MPVLDNNTKGQKCYFSNNLYKSRPSFRGCSHIHLRWRMSAMKTTRDKTAYYPLQSQKLLPQEVGRTKDI